MGENRLARIGKAALRTGPVLAAGLLSFFLGYYNFGHDGYGNAYYTAALRSMAQSLHNFFFVSFDPAGFLSVDKPPVALWAEALLVRLFGFHTAVILLPGALAAAASVLVLQRTVQRAFGYGAGLASAAALAVTPVFVAASRSDNPDAVFALLLVLAAWAALRAAESGRLRWFLLTAVFLGLAFNTKTLVACLALPACGLAFLFARLPGRRLAAWAALSFAVFAAVSFAWIAAVDLTPASQRPFVGSSTKNTELDLTFGYNGFSRVFAKGRAGDAAHHDVTGRAQNPARDTAEKNGGAGTDGRPAPGIQRLFVQPYGDQAAWLAAFALAGAAAAAVLLLAVRKKPAAAQAGVRSAALPARAPAPLLAGQGSAAGYPAWASPATAAPAPPLNEKRAFDAAAQDDGDGRLRLASLLLWGGWAAVMTVFFSLYRELTHRYYLNILAPAVAALCGIGLVSMVRLARRHGKWYALFLPGAFVFGGALQMRLLAAYPAWRSLLWAFPALAALLGCAAGAAALRGRRGRTLRRLVPGLTGAAFCCLLAVPLAWSLLAVAGRVAGADAAAGPAALGRIGTASPVPLTTLLGKLRENDTAVPPTSAGERGLEKYLTAHRGSAEFLAASPSTAGAQDFIIDTGLPAMAVGGFNGANPILTLSQFQTLTEQGKVRYFWAPAVGGSAKGRAAGESERAAPPLRAPAPAALAAERNAGRKGGEGQAREKAQRRARANAEKKAQGKKAENAQTLQRGSAANTAILQWVRRNSVVVPRRDYAAYVTGAPGILYRLLPPKKPEPGKS